MLLAPFQMPNAVKPIGSLKRGRVVPRGPGGVVTISESKNCAAVISELVFRRGPAKSAGKLNTGENRTESAKSGRLLKNGATPLASAICLNSNRCSQLNDSAMPLSNL